jgi:hypothetical protein
MFMPIPDDIRHYYHGPREESDRPLIAQYAITKKDAGSAKSIAAIAEPCSRRLAILEILHDFKQLGGARTVRAKARVLAVRAAAHQLTRSGT